MGNKSSEYGDIDSQQNIKVDSSPSICSDDSRTIENLRNIVGETVYTHSNLPRVISNIIAEYYYSWVVEIKNNNWTETFTMKLARELSDENQLIDFLELKSDVKGSLAHEWVSFYDGRLADVHFTNLSPVGRDVWIEKRADRWIKSGRINCGFMHPGDNAAVQFLISKCVEERDVKILDMLIESGKNINLLSIADWARYDQIHALARRHEYPISDILNHPLLRRMLTYEWKQPINDSWMVLKNPLIPSYAEQIKNKPNELRWLFMRIRANVWDEYHERVKIKSVDDIKALTDRLVESHHTIG